MDPDPATLEPPDDDLPAVPAEEPVDAGPRRYPSTLGGAFYLIVLAASTAGIVMAGTGDWRTGIRVIGGALLFAAVVRLVLSNEDAGMLAVRHRAVDASLLITGGALLLLLAETIPNQPG